MRHQQIQLMQDIKFRLMVSGIENEHLAEQIAREWVTKR